MFPLLFCLSFFPFINGWLNYKYNQGVCLVLTWDQAQFERFSYILSNGYRFRFVLPAGM